MATLVHTGTQAQVSFGSSITVNSPSATAGNKLILEIGWFDHTVVGAAETLSAPAGWTADYNPPGFLANLPGFGNCSCGYVVYSKIAAGGVESPVVSAPHAAQLFANAIITEWNGMGAHDTADSSSIVNNVTASATTGATVPNTGTLASANSTIFTGVTVLAGNGLNPAGIAFSGGGWTTDVSDQDTGNTIGSLFGHKTVSVNTALGAVYTWTSDVTMAAIQASVVVFSDAGSDVLMPMQMN